MTDATISRSDSTSDGEAIRIRYTRAAYDMGPPIPKISYNVMAGWEASCLLCEKCTMLTAKQADRPPGSQIICSWPRQQGTAPFREGGLPEAVGRLFVSDMPCHPPTMRVAFPASILLLAGYAVSRDTVQPRWTTRRVPSTTAMERPRCCRAWPARYCAPLRAAKPRLPGRAPRWSDRRRLRRCDSLACRPSTRARRSRPQAAAHPGPPRQRARR